MERKEVQFGTHEVAALATFLAELERQGVTYTVRNLGGGWAVLLTGGFW